MTLIVVKRNEQELADWLSTEWGFLTGLGRYNFKPIELQYYQEAFLKNTARFRCINKARQIGYSYIFALEALARCLLRENHTSVIVSYNQDDSKEKILIARQVHEMLPLAYQKKYASDSKTELEFESNGPYKLVSRILSAPSKAPRGKSSDLYLDECAHYGNDREIYNGSTAVVIHGKGQITVASTPLGQRGIFYDIVSNKGNRFWRYARQNVPWWLSSFLCTDVKRAAIEAPEMETEDRVAEFGNEELIFQFDNLTSIDDFRQEFECSFISDQESYYPYELILSNVYKDMELYTDYSMISIPKDTRIVAGFDVGRTRDFSELVVLRERKGHFRTLVLKRFDRVPFKTQENELRELLETLPVARLSIDKNGLGMHLAENLAADYPNVVGENFTNENKERWATNVKMLLQQNKIDLPADKDLVRQINSINRKVLPSGRVGYESNDSTRGHADRFWAFALACQKEKAPPRRPAEIGVRII